MCKERVSGHCSLYLENMDLEVIGMLELCNLEDEEEGVDDFTSGRSLRAT